MDENNRNMLLAILLSGMVLIAWHFFYAGPKLQEAQERERRLAVQKTAPSQTTGAQATVPGTAGTTAQPGAQPGGAISPAGSPPVPGAAVPGATVAAATREDRIAASPRIAIDAEALKGSISLKGGRIDDLVLPQYKQEVKPGSPPVVLFSPSGSPQPFYAEFGWYVPAGSTVKVPTGVPDSDVTTPDVGVTTVMPGVSLSMFENASAGGTAATPL